MHTCESTIDTQVLDTDLALIRYLRGRVPEEIVRRRLELEKRGPEPVFDLRNRTLHPENWSGVAPLLRFLLRFPGAYERGQRNAHSLVLRQQPLTVRGLGADFRGYRIVQISDPHLDSSPHFADTLIDALEGVQADLCVFTGDFRFQTDGDSGPALEAMARLVNALPTPAYAVLGNHDALTMLPELETLGVRVLFNEGLALTRRGATLWLAGVDDPHYFGLHDLTTARAGCPDDAPALLLSHSPELYAEAAAAGYQVMLCGHTHGGQICLPGGIPLFTNARCPRRYCRGTWNVGALRGYTSTGAGTSVLDVRFNSPAEVVVHILESEPGS
ncbi:MAG: metallophosphoesterase [Aquisalimonadaceae bacterium]